MHQRSSVGDGRFLTTSSDVTNQWPGLVSRRRWQLSQFERGRIIGMIEAGPKSGHPQQTSRREARHIVRNSRVQPTASSTAIQAQVAPSLRAAMFSRTIRRRLAEGHLESQRPLRVLPLTPTH
ncbi:transposable element Tcb1 transposase [Trichonephila clavipes]|nr:transposable element Tcb1 transposase [Trichonephila clavipes]